MISKTLIQNSYAIFGFDFVVLFLKSSFYYLDNFTIAIIDFFMIYTKLLFHLLPFKNFFKHVKFCKNFQLGMLFLIVLCYS